MGNAGTSSDMDLKAQFQNPSKLYRPLQIIHGFDGLVSLDDPNLRTVFKGKLEELQKAGLGGVVCNVSFKNYLQDEKQWKLFSLGLELCKELGMRVWIYDEEGYPSGSAGGLVLKKNPAYEAQELILDKNSPSGYQIRPAYEGTHASNNFHKARRYPNLLDAEADRTFIEITHDAYAKIAQAQFGNMIEAFFTDEPSMIACSLGQIPESARKNVPTIDPLDPKVQRLPSVPWVQDLPQLFKEQYGYDLIPKIASLFSGEKAEDKKIRRDYWALVSRMLDQRFFIAIRNWCRNHNIASSGHVLGEESLVQHPALNGNALRNLQAMDIPGIDVLSSNPGNVYGGYAVTGNLGGSAALLNGTRRVMTETSDFSERMNNHSTSLEEICAAAAWQFALGITDFNLYYNRADRSPQEYQRYCDYVGRLGALLTPAKRVVRVALYYPIYDLWTGYRPTAEPLSPKTQPELEQKIAQSFSEACAQLEREECVFCLVDHGHLAQAKVTGKQIEIEHAVFDAVAIPLIDEMPVSAQKQLKAFQSAGGTVVDLTLPDWKIKLSPYKAIAIKSDQPGCLTARFHRESMDIVLFVNTTNQPWQGLIDKSENSKTSLWRFMDGSVSVIENNNKNIPIQLTPYESIALVLEK